MSERDWLWSAREAIRVGAQPDVETLRGARPRLVDADSAAAITSLVLFGFVTAAAVFRERLTPGMFDLIASVLRTLSAAFLVRVIVGCARVIIRLVKDRVASRASLALTPHGLLLDVAGHEQVAVRSAVLGVTRVKPRSTRGLAPRVEDVLVVLRGAHGRPQYLSVPPYFAASADILIARLARWLRDAEPPALGSGRAPEGDPELRYRRAAEGHVQPDDLVVPEGSGYLLRAPYVALLGILFALDVLQTSGNLRDAVLGPVVGACGISLTLLVGWFGFLQARRTSRLGIGMLLTPEELLVRGRAGVVGLPWQQLSDVSVQTSARWSPFVGSYAARTLTLLTQDGQRLLFDASFLAVPVEVIAVLCERYRVRPSAEA